MVLEFCSKGSLQDAMDRPVPRSPALLSHACSCRLSVCSLCSHPAAPQQALQLPTAQQDSPQNATAAALTCSQHTLHHCHPLLWPNDLSLTSQIPSCRGSFRRRGTNDGSADLGAILETAVEIAGAMAHLHSLDILHGDLTAANILLTSSTGERSEGWPLG